MFRKFRKWIFEKYEVKSPNPSSIFINEVKNSSISINDRTSFTVTEKWFSDLLSISYDDEIKFKYIPDLHQSNKFIEEDLTNVLDFQKWLEYYVNQLRLCEDYIQIFHKSYIDFLQIIEFDGMEITNEYYPFLNKLQDLAENLPVLKNELNFCMGIFEKSDSEFLSEKNNLKKIRNPVESELSFEQLDVSNFFEKMSGNMQAIRRLFQNYNQIFSELNHFNLMLNEVLYTDSATIIYGKAGTGKTHILAHIISEVTGSGNNVLFLKPKRFSGDNINFNDKLLELLQIPKGYTLHEILNLLNTFAKSKNRRCFFIIDALNETTKSSIGFSNIWQIYLQDFINTINQFSNLYIICTLRSSYVDSIWKTRPSSLKELDGFGNEEDIAELCRKYFNFYKIEVTNFNVADLSIFKFPLLLDLYCKLTNGLRSENKVISLKATIHIR